MFASGGFRAGSIREIAEIVGMSQSGLLHHFETKSDLLASVLALRDERSRHLIPEAPGIETLRAFLRLIEYNQTTPGLVSLHCVLSAEATDPEHPAHSYFAVRYRDVVANIVQALQQMDREGILVEGVDAPAEARKIVALLDGLQLQWLLNPASVDMATDVRAHFQSLSRTPL